MKRNSQGAQPKAEALFDVFIDLHVLHAAIKEPVTAEQLVDALTRRGYKVSDRSISALLRKFERRGWLRVRKAQVGSARYFQATRNGKRTLDQSRPLVSVLFAELSSESARRS